MLWMISVVNQCVLNLSNDLEVGKITDLVTLSQTAFEIKPALMFYIK